MADIGLVFDSGIKTLELKDEKGNSVEVSFNPYDALFLFAIMDAAEKLDAEQAKLRVPTADNWRDYYKTALEVDKSMKKIIDDLFGAPICETLFPRQTVYAVGNGLPVWTNLLYAVVDHMDVGLAEEKKKAQERIRKYSAKYKKK